MNHPSLNVSSLATPSSSSAIGILGLGSIGCLIASQISSSVKCYALARGNSSHFNFTLHNGDLSTKFELPAWQGESLNILLVCCKAPQCLSALQEWQRALKSNTQIVLLQNGFGQQDEIHQLYPDNALFAASTTEGANRISREHIQYAGKGTTQWGYYAGPKEDLKLDLSRLSGTHIEQDNIKQILLDKLAINAVINPLTVIYDCPNGELLTNKKAYSEFKALCFEIQDFYNQMQWSLSFELLQRATSIAQATQHNISSMLQDVRNHQVTEIDYINGYLVNKAIENNIPVPINQLLHSKIKSLRQDD